MLLPLPDLPGLPNFAAFNQLRAERSSMRMPIRLFFLSTPLMLVCLMFAPVQRVTHGQPDLTASPVTPVQPTSEAAKLKTLEELCQTDPVAALNLVWATHRSTVEGYSCTFIKRERIKGKLREREKIAVEFQESPFAVKMKWLEGVGRAESMLFVQGENDNKLLIIPSNAVAKKGLMLLGKPYASRATDSADATDAARSPVTQFGMENALKKMIVAWQTAKERQQLDVTYQGIKPIPELNGRPCYVLTRKCATPEEDGLTNVTAYIDVENHLVVGAVLKISDNLLAEYYYADLKLNPKFNVQHFAAKNFK